MNFISFIYQACVNVELISPRPERGPECEPFHLHFSRNNNIGFESAIHTTGLKGHLDWSWYTLIVCHSWPCRGELFNSYGDNNKTMTCSRTNLSVTFQILNITSFFGGYFYCLCFSFSYSFWNQFSINIF